MRLFVLALALLCLCGCAGPIAEASQAKTPLPAVTQILTPPAATARPDVAHNLSQIDPLGFLHDAEAADWCAADLAHKYGATPTPVPNLYEIPNYLLGNYEARLFIQTAGGKVRQAVAAQTQEEPDSAFADVYLSMVETLGLPDKTFALGNDCSDLIPISQSMMLNNYAPVIARWHLTDRIIEIGERVRGNIPAMWYIAAYTERLDFAAIYSYPFGNDCCPHGAPTYFDPMGLYQDPALFSGDALTVLSQYGAQAAYPHDIERDSPDATPAPLKYIAKGLEICGHAAYFEIQETSAASAYQGHPAVSYYIPLEDLPPERAKALFHTLLQAIDEAVGAEARNDHRLEGVDINNAEAFANGTFSVSWDIGSAPSGLALHYVALADSWNDCEASFSPKEHYIQIRLKPISHKS